MPKRLTANFVSSVTDAGRYYDTEHGLFLKVNPAGKSGRAGAKSWAQRITIDGHRRDIGLGSAKYVTLKEARNKAFENKRTVAMGGNPVSERRAAKDIPTFEEVAREVIELKSKTLKNKKAADQWPSSLQTYVFPFIAKTKVDQVSTEDVVRCLKPIWETKNDTADKVRGRIKIILDTAKANGHRTGDNVAEWRGHLEHILPKKKGKKEHFPAVAQDDLSRWWAHLAQRKGVGAEALRFLTLTGARSNEVFEMRWDQVDLVKGIWARSADDMKSARGHKVPLPTHALDILKARPEGTGAELVFPSPKGGELSENALNTLMKKMHEGELKAGRAGYVDSDSKRRAVPHGMRSSLRTWCADTGYDRELSEYVLSHSIGSEAERSYQRADMIDRRRDLLDHWWRVLEGLS